MKLRIVSMLRILVYVLLVCIVISFLRFRLTFIILSEFSRIRYQDNLTTMGWMSMQMWPLIYSICACWVTHSIGTNSKILWTLGGVLDVLIYFLSIMIIVFFNNYHYQPEAVALLSATENIFLLFLFQFLKKKVLRFLVTQ